MPRSKDQPGWSDVKRRLQDWDRPQLLGLLQDLFAFSPENRQFLTARLLRESARPTARDGAAPPPAGSAIPDEKVLDSYRRRIHRAFFGSVRPGGDLNLAAARKAIRDYRQATGDLGGTLELMVYYVETGTAFTVEFGDIDGPFYDSLCSMLSAVVKQFMTPLGKAAYPRYQERLAALEKATKWMGWGYGDFVGDAVAGLEEELGPQQGPMTSA
jgi:hypothetical protein